MTLAKDSYIAHVSWDKKIPTKKIEKRREGFRA